MITDLTKTKKIKFIVKLISKDLKFKIFYFLIVLKI